jgi:hypothetical protein
VSTALLADSDSIPNLSDGHDNPAALTPALSHAHSFALIWRYASFSPKGREKEREFLLSEGEG